MMGLIIAIHVTICAFLIGIILIQSGRGGGLVEGFSGMESMFGTKTNAFLTRTTTILSTLFFITCVGLAVLSARQSRSLLKDIQQAPAPVQTQAPAQTQTPPQTQAPAQTQNPVEEKESQEVPKTE